MASAHETRTTLQAVSKRSPKDSSKAPWLVVRWSKQNSARRIPLPHQLTNSTDPDPPLKVRSVDARSRETRPGVLLFYRLLERQSQPDSCTRIWGRIMAAEHRLLLDTFADARRTWDDLVGLQPDVMAGSGNLKQSDLAELERRVEAHRATIDLLAGAIETEPLDQSIKSVASTERTGISNRKSASDEAQDRQEHPPLDTSSPPPEDAAGRVGEQPLDDIRDRHTSHKAGSRSIAQKESESRYPDRSMPASRKVTGAFGKEPKEPRNE